MIIFLYGDDTFRNRKKLNELKSKFLREIDPTGSNLITVDGEKAKLGQINDAVSPMALFSRKRMIIIENIFLNKGASIYKETMVLLKAIKDDQEANIIIFTDSITDKEKLTKEKSTLFKFLSQQKFSQQFKALSNTEVMDWIKSEFQNQGMRISRDALLQLAALAGNDLWQLNNEINKLANYKKSKYENNTDEIIPIEIEDVRLMVRGAIDENIFSLTDAISNKNRPMALKILEEQLEAGLTESYVLSMVLRQFKILLQIREALDNGFSSRKIISELKLHPFVAQKGIIQARNYSVDSLKIIIKNLVEMDYSMKSGVADIKTSLASLIATL